MICGQREALPFDLLPQESRDPYRQPTGIREHHPDLPLPHIFTIHITRDQDRTIHPPKPNRTERVLLRVWVQEERQRQVIGHPGINGRPASGFEREPEGVGDGTVDPGLLVKGLERAFEGG